MVVKTLAFVSYLSVMSFSQLAPFYPLEAKDANVDVFWVGFVLGYENFLSLIVLE